MAKQNQNGEDPEENKYNESDDTFGLPEIEYEPLKRDEPQYEATESKYEESQYREEPADEPEYAHEEPVEDTRHTYRSSYSSYLDDDKPPMWPKVLGILIGVILIAGAGYYYFGIYSPEQKKIAKEKEEQRLREEAEARKRDEDLKADLRRQEEANQRRADSLARIPKEGSVETLTARTGRYYVVVASAIDDDLLIDYATRLAKAGTPCKVIPPFGKTKFHRLAIDDKDSYAEAQAKADEMKGGDFGSELWVVRY